MLLLGFCIHQSFLPLRSRSGLSSALLKEDTSSLKNLMMVGQLRIEVGMNF